MIELLVIALLLWLWVIERRLNAMRVTLRALRQDVDEIRQASRRTSGEADPTEASDRPASAAMVAPTSPDRAIPRPAPQHTT